MSSLKRTIDYLMFKCVAHNEDVLDDLIHESLARKSGILELFAKMDSIDGVTFERDRNRLRIESSVDIKGSMREFHSAMMDNQRYFEIDNRTKVSALMQVFNVFFGDSIPLQLNEMHSTVFKHYGYNVPSGMKTTRAFNKLFDTLLDDAPDYAKQDIRRRQAIAIDNMITRSEKSVIYWSVDTYDFMRMSHGNSWDSCYRIDHGGYRAGVIGYIRDSVSSIMYTENERDDHSLNNRSHVIIDHKGIYASRIYGGSMDRFTELRENAILKIADVFGGVDVIGRTTYNTLSRHGNCCGYADYRLGDYYYYVMNDVVNGDAENSYVSNAPTCLECGNEYNDDESTSCNDCDSEHVCEICRDSIHRGGEYFINGSTYCHDCVSYCDSCNEYHVSENMLQLPVRYGDYVCPDCYDEQTSTCEHCDTVVMQDDIYEIDGDYYCEDCITQCDICDELIAPNDVTTVDGETLCIDCLNDKTATCSTCGELHLIDNMDYNERTENYYCDADCMERGILGDEI